MTRRPEEIEVKEFAVSWRGYDRDEVRGFLREVAVAVRGTTTATAPGDGDQKLHDPSLVEWPDLPGSAAAATGPVPETIAEREFSLAWRGYSRDEVRSFLQEIADEVRGIDPSLDTTAEADRAVDAGAGHSSEDTAVASDAEPISSPADAEPISADDQPASEPTDEPRTTSAVEVEVAVVERATKAAMAVRSDARRATLAMRDGVDHYADDREHAAEQVRRDAEAYAARTRAAVDRDALVVRTRLVADSNARLLARTQATPPQIITEPAPEPEPAPAPHLESLAAADLHRLGNDLARAQTSIARLEAELSEMSTDLDAATDHTGADAAELERRQAALRREERRLDSRRAEIEALQADAAHPGPSPNELDRRTASLEREDRRLDTLGAEVETLQANALDQRAEAERLRAEAQQLRDEAAAVLSQARREAAPTTAGERRPDDGPVRARPGSGRGARPITRTAPPGLGMTPEADASTADDDLVDMVREALDDGLTADD